jgi:3-hydroxymyristoyl/3-hydroxydecanoyl-(acyl carrier protein) dehydratase
MWRPWPDRGILAFSWEENKPDAHYFMAIDNVKFRQPVMPGDAWT